MKHSVNVIISSKSSINGGVWKSEIYNPPNKKITLRSEKLPLSRYDLELDALIMSLQDIEQPSIVNVYSRSKTLSHKWKNAHVETRHILRLKVVRRKKRRYQR